MKFIRKMARRATAVLLAFIMFSTYAPTFLLDLFASNSANFTISLSEALVAAGSRTPVWGDALEGQATLSWDIPDVDHMDRLVFPIRTAAGGHQIIAMHFWRTGLEEMWVEYRVFGSANDTMTGGFGGEITNALWNHFEANFGTLGAGGPANFLPPSHADWMDHNSYIDPPPLIPPLVFNPNRIVSPLQPLVTSSGLYDRDFGGPRLATSVEQPMFRVAPGYGFSFNMQAGAGVHNPAAAHAVSFLWDETGGATSFHVTVGGLQKGAFYDFTLSRSGAFTEVDLQPNPPFVGMLDPLRLQYVHTADDIIDTLRAFTGFNMSTVPLAEHVQAWIDDDPPNLLTLNNRPVQNRAGVNRENFDYLFWNPTGSAVLGPARDEFLLGFTNWELPGRNRMGSGPLDPLWHPWNILDHSWPVHVGNNDFLPGFAGTRAITQENFLPQRDYPNNMLRLHVEKPWIFEAGTGGTQGWTRIDGDEFENISLNFNVDLRIPPNTFDTFAYSNIFATHTVLPSGDPDFPVRGTPAHVAFPDGSTITRPSTDAAGHSGTYIYILGLEPSRVFEHFHVEILPPSMAVLRAELDVDVVIGDGTGSVGRFWVDNVYTFLEFDVVFIGGNFHVRIFPYVDALGDYSVLWNNQITAPVHSAGRDVLFIPIEPMGTSAFLQVRFDTQVPDMGYIYSQVMVFVPTFDRHIFTEPGNFVLTPDNPELTTYGPLRLDEATFTVNVGWDLTTVEQLQDYFIDVNQGRGTAHAFNVPPSSEPPLGARPYPAGGPNMWYLPVDELVFTYVLNRRFSPWDEDGRPFAFVDVTVRRMPMGSTATTGRWFEWDYDIREHPDVEGTFQVLADPVGPSPVPVPTAVHINSTGATPGVTHQAMILDQFGMPYTGSGNFTWELDVTSGGTAEINPTNGTIIPDVATNPPTSYTITATFNGVYGPTTRSLHVPYIPDLTAPTDIDIITTPTNGTVFQGNSLALAAHVEPPAAPVTPLPVPSAFQNVRWEVRGAEILPATIPPTFHPAPAGAVIGQNGILHVNRSVPIGTQLNVIAHTTSFGVTHTSAPHLVTVSAPERSIAINNNTMEDMVRIGVGGANGMDFAGGIRLDMIASAMGATTPPLPHFFQFPEIYHITTQLFDINANENRDEPITPPLPESNSQPMTLDLPVSLDFPPPQNLRLSINENDDPYREGGFFDLSFDVPLARMRHYIATNVRRDQDVDVTLRIFISEDQNAIQNIALDDGSDRSPNGTTRRLIQTTVDHELADGSTQTIPTIVNGITQLVNPFTEAQREMMRGNVAVLEIPLQGARLFGDDQSLSQILRLHGLDRNRQYFVTMDATIQFSNPPAQPYRDYSTATNIVGITTLGDLAPPDVDGISPAAPRDLRLDDVSVYRANLSWLPVAPLVPQGGEIRYQILRMHADDLPNELLDNRNLTMSQVLAEIDSLGIGGLQEALITSGSNQVLRYGTGQIAPNMTLRHGTLTDAPDDTEQRVIFIDGNLVPNTLYFYYVRAVWETLGGQTFSAWVGISVTTTLVEPPQNLRVELAPWIGGTLWMDFDPRYQFVIRFDAPMETLEGHGTNFDFQYSLLVGDESMWEPPLTLTSAMLLERIPTPGQDGFFQFTYLISSLWPGTQYSIRVRTQDLINGDFSLYSNIATTRTDSDQAAINRDRDLANLHQYLRDLIAEFIRQHYWTAQNTQNVFSAVYRPSMINNIVETNDTMIRLAMTGQDINVYYLPQALFLRTWQTEQGFIIAKDDMEIAIPSHAFNMIDNEAILQAQQRIRDVPSVLDYFVRITAVVRDHGEDVVIHSRQPAGQEIVLNFEVVETSMTVSQLDDDILAVLRHRLDIDYYTQPFVEEIIQMLDREESHETMVRRLHQIADVIMNQMAAYVNSQLLPTLDRIYEVNYVSQPVSIRLMNQPTTAVVNGFRFAGTNWVQQEVNIQGNARTMRTSGTGAFAFNIQNLNLPGISDMQGNQTLTEIFVRYGLHDFLGTDAAFNLDANISLSAVQGVAARLAGAPEATNPQNWLRNQGYIVPVRGASSNATTQEVIYTLMAVYEIRSNTSISTLRISNFNAASGITGIDQRFRPAIQAAFELEIFTDANMVPTAPISVEDVLRMILAINQRVPL
ncbi:MAG: hypothetical protein FWE34_08140 [Defluviitaleaceae bacterium]|nr:hypothetical protein [Defluviitaleaceae bacterium]